MLKSKKFWYILLFAILYLIVAFSSFFHACSFFALANNTWMSVILAFAFEIGQAAVLFSLLTSSKDRSRIMPWVLMTMFTLVQVIGNVFSSYKHIMINSVENLKYFKEPIFIWTQLPDQEATVIVTYIIGALLPIAALLLTSMITNYLNDEEEKLKDNNLTVLKIPENLVGTDMNDDGPLKGPLGDQPIIENENPIIVPESSQKDLDKVYKEEHEDKEQATDEEKNIEEEPIKKENDNETNQDIQQVKEEIKENKYIPNEEELKRADAMISGQMINSPKKKIESHFIN